MGKSDVSAWKPGFRIAAFATCLAVCVVMLGAFTRLVDAGLGCPDWPVCYGHILWPMETHEIAAANEAFPDTPVDNRKTWPEQVHRIFASSLGIFCIALVAIAARQRFKEKDLTIPLKLPLFLLLLVIVQGMFGMWTVTLKLWPQVVTAHLLGGFATLSLLFLLTLRLSNVQWTIAPALILSLQGVKPWLSMAIIMLIVQIMLGGWTTSNYAALACPDFPTCQSVWVPAMDFVAGFNFFQDIGPNYLGGVMDSAARTAIHFSHRVGAVLVTFFTLILITRLLKIDCIHTRSWAKRLLAVLLLQLALGVCNVVFALPLAVAVAHNAVGALLLLTLVGLSHRVYTARVETAIS